MPGSATAEKLAESVFDQVKAFIDREFARRSEKLFAELDRRISAIPVPKNGTDGKDGAAGRDGANGRDGRDAPTLDEIGGLIKSAVDMIPKPKDGAPGVNGRDGAPGLDGKDGEPGPPGARGMPGERGEKGIDGKDGANGIDGKDGKPGADGQKGLDGVAGRDGRDGTNGERGERGEKGMDGEAGRDGRDGTPGARGEQGKDGAPGANGERGLDGAKGVDGGTGAPGRDGIDAFPLESLAAALEDGNVLVLRYQAGEVRKEFRLPLGTPFDGGAYRSGHAYKRGAGVTWGGGWWIAQKETTERPGGGSPDWRLAVKPGRDGKDAERSPE